jgi:putative nucleotidyltransferase with HDIG domain
MKESKVKWIIDKVNKLPTLPHIANKITSLIKDPTCTAIKVSEIIDKDQSLTTKALRLVNSSYYSLCAGVTNVQHAVALLGFKTISQMVISIAVFDVFKGRYGEEFDRVGFWKHSIGCAVISRMIAEKIHYPKLDDSFTAGLLHDIGKVVIDQYLHEEMIEIIKLVQEKDISFVDAENEVLGLSHADIGGQVMENWNIPSSITVAVKYHHQEIDKRNDSLLSQDLIVDIVRLSDVICKRAKFGSTGDTIMPEMNQDLWDRLDINQDSINEIVEVSDEEVEKAEVILELT